MIASLSLPALANAGFLIAALILYAAFGGADFGGGILELFKGKTLRAEQEELITKAMGPVWEANHVWLILAVVILFVGFPPAFYLVSTAFHIPLTIALFGIALRGCAFTFRHYDAEKDPGSQAWYTRIFAASSFLTPVALGTVAGGLLLGRGAMTAPDFHTGFIAPWANPFALSVGVFFASLCAFLAAAYLTGEATSAELKRHFRARARITNLIAVVAGVGVFGGAKLTDFDLAAMFFAHPVALASMAVATILVTLLMHSLRRECSALYVRFLAAAQMALVLVGWIALQAPALVAKPAPDAAQEVMLVCLVFGSALIFPALYLLLRVFKRTSEVAR